MLQGLRNRTRYITGTVRSDNKFHLKPRIAISSPEGVRGQVSDPARSAEDTQKLHGDICNEGGMMGALGRTELCQWRGLSSVGVGEPVIAISWTGIQMTAPPVHYVPPDP